MQLNHRIITSHLIKLNSLCRDMNENVKYLQKSPERTTSISVTLKLLQCLVQLWEKCLTRKNALTIFTKIFIDQPNLTIPILTNPNLPSNSRTRG